jgi:hypothetical protein
LRITDGMRKAAEEVDREVALLAGHASEESAATLVPFRLAWGRLMDLLVLGRPPARGQCPHCGCDGMANATRCGRCWTELVPGEGIIR